MTTTTMPPPIQRRTLFIVGGVVAAAIAVFVVVKIVNKPAEQEATTERTTPWLEDGVIHFPAAFGEREKIEFTAATENELTPEVYVTGEVTFDQRRVVDIGARIEGRLRAVLKVEGEDVKAGEIVAELESVEIGRAQAEVLKVRARESLAKLDAERERKLADAKISPERDAQFAQYNLEALVAERVAAEKSLEAFGGSMSGDIGVLKLKSPIAGRVIEMKGRRGQTVSPTDTMMIVADLEKVWVELTVFERDIPAVREGDKVDIKLPANRTQSFPGTVVHVSEIIDPDRRAGHVRVELDNTDGRLMPGLSVTAYIHASGPRNQQLTVPKSAVTRIDGKPTVFVKVGTDAVEPRPLKIGAEDETNIAVIEGLKAGEEVAKSGVLALKAEVFR